MQREKLVAQSILVVDDDRELAAVLAEFLEGEGYTVRLAHSAASTLERLDGEPFAVMLLDLQLPDGDGVELMRRVLAREAAPDVVILTGHASLDSAMAAIESGAAGYVVKPASFERLATVVGRVIERRGLVRENERLNAELADRLTEAEALLGISSTLTSTLKLDEALRRICRELVRLTGADTAAAYLLDPARDVLVPTAAYHVPKEHLELLATSVIPLREEGFYLSIWSDRRPVASDDVAADPRFRHELFRGIPHRSGLVLPLVLDADVAGAFYVVWWKARRTFTERELALLQQVSGQVALLLKNARLFDQAERDRQRLETLYDLARRLGTVHDTDAILSLIVNEATRLLGAEAAGIRLLEGEDLVVRAQTESAAAIMARPRIKVGESLTGAVVAGGEPVVVEDIAADPRYDPAHRRGALESGFHGFLGVPLRTRGRIIGALNVYTKGQRRFTPDEVSLLAGFADQAALALEKGRLLRGAEEGRELLDRLYRVAIGMQRSWDRAERLRAFVQGAHDVVGFDRVQVLLVTPDGAAFEPVAGHGAAAPTRLPVSPAAGFFYDAYRSGRPVALVADDLGAFHAVDSTDAAAGTSRYLIAPLVVGDRAIGVAVGETEPGGRPIDTARVEPFLLLCQQLAMALEETRLYEEARAREQEATRLYAVTRQLASTLDLDQVLDLITARALEVLECDAAGIYVYDEARRGLAFRRGLNLDRELTAQLVLQPGEGVAGRAFQERRPVWTRDREADGALRYEPRARELIRARAPRAYLAVPIVSRGEVFGVLVDYFFEPHDFTAGEVRLLSALADQAALALENARLYAETRAREEEARRVSTGLALLNQASRALHRTLEVDAMLRGALDELARAFGADAALVNLLSEAGDLQRSVGQWISEAHGRDVAYRPQRGVSQLVRETRAPLVLRDVAERRDIVHPAHFTHGVTSLAAFPILGQGRDVLGVLFLYYTRPQAFPDTEVQLLAAYADQLATALENAQLYEEAQTRRTRLALIFDSTSDGIVLLDRDGRIEAANRRAAEMLGFDAQSASRLSLAELLVDLLRTPADYLRTVTALRAILSDPDRGGGGDLETLRPARRVLEWVGQATRNAAGTTVGVTLTFRDVTQERQVSQMKSDFVSFVTHQLRTPLAGIRWMLELAGQDTGVGAETRSYLEDAQAANQRLVDLVNDLLNVSRLEGGKLSIVVQPTDLGALTRSVADEVGALVREKQHRLTIAGEADAPPVAADPQLLRQVVLNLVANAIKYTPPGGDIAIRLASDGAGVTWLVRDTGIGIPRDGQRRLFEKFYRAENVLTIETEGTGLGLYLVRLIVDQHGGRVWCESEEGRGSTFAFTLPAAGGRS